MNTVQPPGVARLNCGPPRGCPLNIAIIALGSMKFMVPALGVVVVFVVADRLKKSGIVVWDCA
jgi:hypothetical protein